MIVGVLPSTDVDAAGYDPRYYAWLTSEYLVDDFTEVVRSELFARNISARLAEQEIVVPPGVIQGSSATGVQHRILTLSFNGNDAADLAQIAGAVAAELRENAVSYFRLLGTDGAGVTLIDGPTIGAVGPGLRSRLEAPLRILLGFLVSVGLIFFLDYLDTSVRNRRELEAMGLPIIGEIPRHK
jgi:capsular polysaccharide biosynthesis protein